MVLCTEPYYRKGGSTYAMKYSHSCRQACIPGFKEVPDIGNTHCTFQKWIGKRLISIKNQWKPQGPMSYC